MGTQQIRFDADEELVRQFDQAIDEKAYETRAEAFRSFMRYMTMDPRLDPKGEVRDDE